MQIIMKLKPNKTNYHSNKNFMKKCNKCKKTLDWDKFRRDRRNADGYYGFCKICAKETQDQYKNKLKEGIIKAF